MSKSFCAAPWLCLLCFRPCQLAFWLDIVSFHILICRSIAFSSSAFPPHIRISDQIKSNQIKSLLLSHHHSTSALVSEILMSVLQTVQKKQQTIYIWTDSAKKTALEHLQCSRQCKKNNNNLHMDRQCKKTTNNLHMDRQCKKNCTGAFTVLQTVPKKKKKFTYGFYMLHVEFTCSTCSIGAPSTMGVNFI